MRRLLLTLILALAAAAPAQAQLMVRHWAAPQGYSCPAGYYNGCAGNVGQIANPNLLSSANLSGQTYASTGLCTRPNCHPPWRIPGVDVANGALTPTASQRDPKTAFPNSCSFPADGAVWCATGNQFNGGPKLMVNATTAPYVLQNINLSAIGGHGCTAIDINDTAATQKITITDWYFENDPTCFGASTVAVPLLIYQATNHVMTSDVEISHFTAIGHGKVSDCCSIPQAGTTNIKNAMAQIVSLIGTNNQTFSYGNVVDWPGHIYALGGQSGNMATSVTQYGNYFENYHPRCPLAHGEQGNIQWITTYHQSYQTTFMGLGGAACLSALDFMSSSATNITNAEIDHEVILNNRIGGQTVDSEPVTVSGMSSGVLTISSGAAQISSGAIFLAGGQNTVFASLISGAQWQSDCGVNLATGIGLSMCPCSNASNAGCFINTNGNYGSSYSDNVGYFRGNAELAIGHGIYTTLNIHDNYFTPTGSRSRVMLLATTGGSCSSPATLANNINMETGASANTWDGGAGSSGCAPSASLIDAQPLGVP